MVDPYCTKDGRGTGLSTGIRGDGFGCGEIGTIFGDGYDFLLTNPDYSGDGYSCDPLDENNVINL